MPSLLNVANTIFGDFAEESQALSYGSTGISLLRTITPFVEFGSLVALGDTPPTGISLLNVSRSIKGEFGVSAPTSTAQLFSGDIGRGTDGLKGSAVYDTFTDAAGTSLVAHNSDGGGSWYAHPAFVSSAAVISNANRLRSNNSGLSAFYHSSTPLDADYEVTVDLTVLGTPIFGIAGVAARMHTTDATFYRFTYDYGLDVCRLHRHLLGVQTQLAASFDDYTPPKITLTLRVIGTQISGLVNGILVCGPITDTAIPSAGRAGLFLHHITTDSNGLHLDEFQAFRTLATPEWVTVLLFAGDSGSGYQSGSQAVVSASQSTFTFDQATTFEGSWLSVRAFSGDRGSGFQTFGTETVLFAGDRGAGVERQQGDTAGTTEPWAYEIAAITEAAFVAATLFWGDSGAGADGQTPPTPEVISFEFGVADAGAAHELAVATAELFSAQVGRSVEAAFPAVAVFSSDVGAGIDGTGRGGSRFIAYHLYANTGIGDAVNYSVPIATVAGLTWSTTLVNTGVWKFGVRAFDTVSLLEERNVDIATVVIDRDWYDRSKAPSSPFGLSLIPRKGGGLRAVWSYQSAGEDRKPVEFRIYKGTAGSPDYAVPSQAVPYSGDREYSIDLVGLVQGQAYTVGVRAYNLSGEELNFATATATADNTPPFGIETLTATATQDGG